uniref:Putative secreted protein n=1 Tax=Anopheles darlingi TaxID=43151 RepID=A0A2M4D839_ANODA
MKEAMLVAVPNHSVIVLLLCTRIVVCRSKLFGDSYPVMPSTRDLSKLKLISIPFSPSLRFQNSELTTVYQLRCDMQSGFVRACDMIRRYR